MFNSPFVTQITSKTNLLLSMRTINLKRYNGNRRMSFVKMKGREEARQKLFFVELATWGRDIPCDGG